MSTRPIAPAPLKKLEQKPIPIQFKTPPSQGGLRGKADISISPSGILNPIPDASTSTSTSSPAAVDDAPALTTEFAFVNISKPSQAVSRENKRFVKSFVRHRTVKSAKAARDADAVQKHGGEKQCAKRALPPAASSPRVAPAPGQLSVISRARASSRPLGRWEIAGWAERYPKATRAELIAVMNNEASTINRNPFTADVVYPVEMDRDGHELVKFMHAEYEVTKLRAAFRPIWFGLFMKDPASFLQLMSTTILHRGFTLGLRNEVKAMQYRQMAWKSLNDRLADPRQCSTDGVMAAILAFLILDHWLKDLDRYLIDKSGLVQIVGMRGGISALENNSELRLLMLWDDVGGATSFDIEPSFGLPSYHLPPLPPEAPIPPSPRFLQIIQRWNTIHDERIIMKLFSDLSIVNSMIDTQIPELYDDPLFLGLYVNPIVMRLLEASRNITAATGRALCIAVLIYLGDIRVEFCSYHTTGYHFIGKLKWLLPTVTWDGLQDLRLWVTVIGGMKAAEHDRPFFIEEVRDAMARLDLPTWSRATEVVESIVWIKAIYGVACEGFGQLVILKARQPQ